MTGDQRDADATTTHHFRSIPLGNADDRVVVLYEPGDLDADTYELIWRDGPVSVWRPRDAGDRSERG